jgi:hypothetical protein
LPDIIDDLELKHPERSLQMPVPEFLIQVPDQVKPNAPVKLLLSIFLLLLIPALS